MSYLLRLVMPDRPGILGAVATALGTAGIDIVSLDVLERGTGVAVDDVVVDLPPDRLPDSLITVAQSVPDVRVESLRPYAGPLDTHRELELLDALARAGGNPPDPAMATKLLAAELPRVFHSGWAVVLSATDDGWEVAASSEAAPARAPRTSCWRPSCRGCSTAGGRWCSRAGRARGGSRPPPTPRRPSMAWSCRGCR